MRGKKSFKQLLMKYSTDFSLCMDTKESAEVVAFEEQREEEKLYSQRSLDEKPLRD